MIILSLQNKLLYAFGTSIVYGHLAETSFVDSLAQQYGLIFQKYAVNGATTRTVTPNNIVSQIQKASTSKPNFIIFDSIANDAYQSVVEDSTQLGEITTNFTDKLNPDTYCGGLETICKDLLIKYRGSKIMYLATHKTCARDYEVQELMYSLSVKICKKWSIPIIDLYNGSNFNTFIDEYRYNYTYDCPDDNGSNHSFDGSGTHPNDIGYRLFYEPLVVNALLAQI